MRLRRYHPTGLVILLLAQGLSTSASALALQGTAEYALALSTHNGNVQKSELVLTPRWDFDLAKSTRGTLIIRGRLDGVDELSPGTPTQRTRSHWNRQTASCLGPG